MGGGASRTTISAWAGEVYFRPNFCYQFCGLIVSRWSLNVCTQEHVQFLSIASLAPLGNKPFGGSMLVLVAVDILASKSIAVGQSLTAASTGTLHAEREERLR